MKLFTLCAVGFLAAIPASAQTVVGNDGVTRIIPKAPVPAEMITAVPSANRLACVVYTERAAFESTIEGPISFEDFEDIGITSNQFGFFDLSSSTNLGAVQPGEIVAGVTFNSLDDSGLGFFLAGSPPDNSSTNIVSGLINGGVVAALDPAVTAYGFDVSNTSSRPISDLDVTAFDADDNMICSTTLPSVGPANAFAGFVSDTPIARVVVIGAPGSDSPNQVVDNVTFGGGDIGGPALTGSLGYGTCPAALPLGRSACRVDASGTFDLDQAQRYTVFLRVQETGRIAKRGEIKPSPTGTASQAIKFSTTAADPASFTLELVAEAGSVAAPSGAATVIGTLAFTKGDAGLRASEGLTAFPNPATNQATLRFAVTGSQAATLAIYDALGREVARPVDGQVSGAVEASFDASALPAGLYVARLVTATGTETVRLSVVR